MTVIDNLYFPYNVISETRGTEQIPGLQQLLDIRFDQVGHRRGAYKVTEWTDIKK